MCQVKFVIFPDINEQVNPGSKIWLPNVRSILKPYCEHCSVGQPSACSESSVGQPSACSVSSRSGEEGWLSTGVYMRTGCYSGGKAWGNCVIRPSDRVDGRREETACGQ